MKSSLKILTTLGISIILLPNLVVQANSTTTPKSLRGTWYEYLGHSSGYSVTKIKRHAVVTYNISNNGKRSYYRNYTAKKKGSLKLHVEKINKNSKKVWGTKTGGSYYQLNQGMNEAESIPFMWIGHRKINGHNYRVLKSYLNMFYFHIASHKKIAKVASYTYSRSNYPSKIGK
ncbi:hypothetical protein [Lactiplantibacillus songbeiensis]|uniref:Extracellular protein n=1 Tax=Lactiplantibacillus songbeiensis TaxID=2559920 RepID=A0ABW4C0R9_9LACO|nr:hypothetical protein [Lactiplantibacillus songbeiensis]